MRSHATAWLMLAASVAAEVLGTLALRHTDGFVRPAPSALALFFYALAIWLMSLSVRQLDIGLAYAIWAGAGTALTAMLGILMYSEPAHLGRLLGIGLIACGVVVLQLDPG